MCRNLGFDIQALGALVWGPVSHGHVLVTPSLLYPYVFVAGHNKYVHFRLTHLIRQRHHSHHSHVLEFGSMPCFMSALTIIIIAACPYTRINFTEWESQVILTGAADHVR